jgi:hypothetical protein
MGGAGDMAEADDFKTELFIFPDGTAVEIIVFDRQGVPAATHAGSCRASASPSPAGGRPSACGSAGRELSLVPAPPRMERDAHVCPVCGSPLVFPLDWTRQNEATWSLTLRCPECETRRHVLLDRGGVEQFNRELYLGAQAVAREADRMCRCNFEEESAKFVEALELGLILPMDF